MEQRYHYATVTEAINELKQQGFTIDFNLEENCIVCDSDPSDEATVYGIQSKSGIKGVLVTGYGIATDSFSTAILNKLDGTIV